MKAWSSEDSVTLREFFRRIPAERLREVMRERCPALIDATTVKDCDAEAIARLASMRAGWEAYETAFFALADRAKSAPPEPGFKDMTT